MTTGPKVYETPANGSIQASSELLQPNENNFSFNANPQTPNVPLQKRSAKVIGNQPSDENISVRSFLEQNGLKIVECGGGGDCLIYSIIRQVFCYNMTNEEFNECKEDIMVAFREGLTMEIEKARQTEVKSNIIEHLDGLSTKLDLIDGILEENDEENKESINAARQAIGELSKSIAQEGTTENTRNKFQELKSQIGGAYGKIASNKEYENKLSLSAKNDAPIGTRIDRDIETIDKHFNGTFKSSFDTLIQEVSTQGTYLDLSKINLVREMLQFIKNQTNKDMTIVLFKDREENGAKFQEITPNEYNPFHFEEIQNKFKDKENHIFLYYSDFGKGASGHYRAIGKFPK